MRYEALIMIVTYAAYMAFTDGIGYRPQCQKLSKLVFLL